MLVREPQRFQGLPACSTLVTERVTVTVAARTKIISGWRSFDQEKVSSRLDHRSGDTPGSRPSASHSDGAWYAGTDTSTDFIHKKIET